MKFRRDDITGRQNPRTEQRDEVETGQLVIRLYSWPAYSSAARQRSDEWQRRAGSWSVRQHNA